MAGITPQPWTFTQLWGKNGASPKVLVLDGPNAPYGRPRKSTIAEPSREVRQSKVMLPGSDTPVRHVFGTQQGAIVLRGRFMDSRIGSPGGARGKGEEVDAFVDDTIPCRAEWGGYWAGSGILGKLQRGFESAEEIAWTLTFEVDTDDTKPVAAPATAPDNASELLNYVVRNFGEIETRAASIPDDITFSPSFLDSVHSLISAINSYTSVPLQFADSVDNFESTVASDVAQFQAGVAQISKACDQLYVTMEAGETDAAAASASAKSQVSWYEQRSAIQQLLLEQLDFLARANLTAERALQGTSDIAVTAGDGDTWESLATRYLGSAGQADLLRSANGATYGTQPLPGQIVHIPKIS